MAGRLMLAMPARSVVAEDRENDLRLEAPDDAHGVGQQHLLGPLAQGLRERPGVAEVEGTGEVLARAVDAAGRQQLLGAEDSQSLTEVGSDQVLSTFAARQREVGRLAAELARHQRQRRGVFVVGVGADDQQPAMRLELGERPVERRVAAGAGRLVDRRQDVGRGRREGRRREQGETGEEEERADGEQRPAGGGAVRGQRRHAGF